MEIPAILTKIRSLEARERRLPREELVELRRNLQTWYSRLAAEILATRLRRLNEIPMLIQHAPDGETRWNLILEQRKLIRELAVLDVQAEMTALLEG